MKKAVRIEGCKAAREFVTDALFLTVIEFPSNKNMYFGYNFALDAFWIADPD